MIPGLARAIVPVLLCGVSAADVLLVDKTPGVGDTTEIQPAVDRAVDGDVVLVHPGTYPGFTVEGKGISVAAQHPETVVVQSIAVKSIAPGSTVVLLGLHTPFDTYGTVPISLRCENVSGLLLVERCLIQGGNGGFSSGGWEGCYAAGMGADIRDSNVAFVDSKVGAGAGCYCSSNCEQTGVLGINIVASQVSFHGCTCWGGDGAGSDICYDQGGGNHAIQAYDSRLFFSKCSAKGGFGFGGGQPVVPYSTPVEWTDSEFFTGYSVTCYGSSAGVSTDPCTVDCTYHDGPARWLAVRGPGGDVLLEGDTVGLLASGAPGDVAFVAVSSDASFAWTTWSIGPLFVTTTFSLVPLGVLPAEGSLTSSFAVAPLGVEEIGLTLQGGFLAADGLLRLGSPVAAVLLDSAY